MREKRTGNVVCRKPGGTYLLRRVAKFGKDESGNIIILAALIMPLMVGGMGLGVEMSYRYQQQRKIHHAADVAAHGAAVRAAFGDQETTYRANGRQLAVDALWDGSGTYALNSPPTNGVYAGQSNGPNGGKLIEVVLSEVQPRLFSKIWKNDDVTLSAYAVAEVMQKREACVLALSPTASRAMEFSGNTSMTLSGCEIASNSNAADSVYQGGSSDLTVECINAVGQVDHSGGITLVSPLCASARENQPPIPDPYAGVPEPSIEGPCENWNALTAGSPHATRNIIATHFHSSGFLSKRFCGKDVAIQQRINFTPGIYILDGVDMTVNANAIVNGSDVMFYLANGATLRINGSGELHLSAMTTGDWAPILFYVSRASAGLSHQLNGDSNSSFEGVIYIPNGELKYNGGAGLAGACTQVIANTISFSGSSDFQSDCTDYPFKEIVAGALVQLVD